MWAAAGKLVVLDVVSLLVLGLWSRLVQAVVLELLDTLVARVLVVWLAVVDTGILVLLFVVGAGVVVVLLDLDSAVLDLDALVALVLIV